MYKDKKIIAIIPARGGSKGLPRKNIRLLAGKPLLSYSIKAAQGSSFIDRCVVSTEDSEIAAVSVEYGAEVIIRPEELAQDQTPTLPVISHVLLELKTKENFVPDVVIILQPTSPLRKSSHIDEAIEKFFSSDFDSLLGASHIYEHRFELDESETFVVPVNKERVGRQYRKPVIIENGFIYISQREVIDQQKILGDKVGSYVVDKKYAIDIDDIDDFLLAELVILNYPEYGNENR